MAQIVENFVLFTIILPITAENLAVKAFTKEGVKI